MLVLVDTNVILRTMEMGHPHHHVAVAALRALHHAGEELCIVPQIHYEFWAVATRPKASNGLGISSAEAEAELVQLGLRCFACSAMNGRFTTGGASW